MEFINLTNLPRFLNAGRKGPVLQFVFAGDLFLLIGGQIVVCYPIPDMKTAEGFKDMAGLLTLLSHTLSMALCNESCNGTKVSVSTSYQLSCLF